ncbi:Uncharacterised protein [Vibrio cholerae]|nr:Uncharacterised protein [Vibrio cholerae]
MGNHVVNDSTDDQCRHKQSRNRRSIAKHVIFNVGEIHRQFGVVLRSDIKRPKPNH